MARQSGPSRSAALSASRCAANASNSSALSTGNFTNCGMLRSCCSLNSRITMPSWLT